MKCTFKKGSCPCHIMTLFIIILALYGIAVSALFIRQQVVVVGIATNYIEPEDTSKLINDVFGTNPDQAYHAEGITALNRSGYSGLALYYLFRPLIPILCIVALCLIVAAVLQICATRKIRKYQRDEENKLLTWIRSNETDEIVCSICADSVISAIADQKRLLQKQNEVHNEDTAKIMHYMENISHQLKTPLTVMRVACERLAMQDSASEPTVNVCLSQINKMTQMIQDLLQLGRFDCNKQKKKFAYSNVQELLETVSNDMDIIAAPKNIDLEITGDPSTVFYCDSYWIKEAIGNVLKNCIEASSNSKIAIHYECSDTSNYIRIDDYGCGFEPEFEKQLFQRYAFTSNSKSSGSGLGMAIAQEAIKMHFGVITAANRAEGGATFRITFPRLDASAIYG